ncbi:MAG: hypothetical protein ACKV2T_29420 [Kofleriaceae bacterium]
MKRLLLIIALASACTETYYYEPGAAGDEESDRTPRAKTSSQFLRTVYADLLGRTPESYEFVVRFNGMEAFRLPIDEERELSTVLDGLGDSMPMRNLLVNGLLHSTEVTVPDKATAGGTDPREYITEQFERLLGRAPNTYELETFADAWKQDPAVGPRTVIRAIIASREYQSQ